MNSSNTFCPSCHIRMEQVSKEAYQCLICEYVFNWNLDKPTKDSAALGVKLYPTSVLRNRHGRMY